MLLPSLRSRFHRARRSTVACSFATFWGVAATARGLPDTSEPSASDDGRAMISPDGLAGGRSIGSARVPGRTLRANTGVGYGYTESVLHEGDAHHRTELELALAGVVAPWLQLSAYWRGRHDVHTGESHDAGTASQLRLASRHRVYTRGPLALALAATLDFPPAPSVVKSLDSVSVEGAAIGSIWLAPRTDLTGSAGLRLERSAHALGDPQTLSPADRLGASASTANALLTGLTLSHSTGRLRGMLEWSWDVLLGSQRASDGPMRLRAAVQADVGTRLSPGFELGVRPLRAPDLEGWVRIEPRVWARLTLAIALDTPAAPSKPARSTARPAPAAPAPVTDSELQGAVRAEGAHAIVASVDVLELNETVHTDAQGRFRIAVRPGDYSLRVSATGFESEVRHARVEAQGVTILVIELRRAR